MKTRHEDQRQAMQEALEMLRQERPGDAMQTLAAALEAPTASERDAALSEVFAPLERAFKTMDVGTHGWSVVRDTLDFIRLRKSAPARRVLDAEEVREVLRGFRLAGYAHIVALIERRLGLELDAAPAKAEHAPCPLCRHARHAGACSVSSVDAAGCPCVARGPGIYRTENTRQTCTCLGRCKGADGLGKGWKCALEGSR